MTMKISLTFAALSAVLIASSAEAFRVCVAGWEDNNTCGFHCQNGDPQDGNWCRNFKSALQKNNANCWGDCSASGGYYFYCSKNTLSPSQCNTHWWSN
ncbi:hypothetical protein BGZ83_001647 [Gryganskiella cystojenkinii]|nr:hypothetical protein BGZ83_001646 [Gryganskiella cystojenkinii]KAG0053115.1 hypothetical protein BGZ83_001647 [Gryganskiella cystojenkinii]